MWFDRLDKFGWDDKDIHLEAATWNLVYTQPDGAFLVQSIGELMVWIAEKRPGENPDTVIEELVDSGIMAHAPLQLQAELQAAGVLSVD